MRVTIPDLAALETVSLFNLSYLHAGHDGRSLDARTGEAGSERQWSPKA
jgi:hypothetical protein